MNVLWSYFWPIFAAGLVIGAIAGSITFRRKRNLSLIVGAALAIAAAPLWHGPLGAADRFSSRVERGAHEALEYYLVPQVSAQLHRDPLSRRLRLAGPANDFQRRELVRLLDQLPGVSSASWSAGGGGLPLIAEGVLLAIAGFLVGLVLAYVVELRRRYNAQWKW
jgi:hypothetical protein